MPRSIRCDVKPDIRQPETYCSPSITQIIAIITEIIQIFVKIFKHNLAHRLNVFMFYWNVSRTIYTHHRKSPLQVSEPIRVVIITRPRPHCLNVFYNQATPDGLGHFHLVNWYDADDLGIERVPLLPPPEVVYRNFNGRTLLIPVIHV